MSMVTRESILIVEDDAGVGFLQSRSLERHGYHVQWVGSREEALSALDRQRFDLAILDYLLPGVGTGLDLYSQIKSAGHDVPVIFVTAFSDQDTVIRALRAGASDFITKSTEYLDYLPEAADRVMRQRRLERQLADTQARFRSFIDNGPAVILFKNAEGRVTYVNRQYELLFSHIDWHHRLEEEVLPGTRSCDLYDGDQTLTSEGCFTQRIEGITMPDGTVGHWLTYTFPIRGTEDTELTGIVAIDVTARTLAERALRDSEAKFRSVTDSALDGIVAVDFERMIISWNQGAKQIFGYDESEILGKSLGLLFVTTGSVPNNILNINHGAALGEHAEFQGRRRDGSEFPFEMSVGQWQTDTETFYSIIIRDISERKRAEESLRQQELQLRQAQKMEAVGTLAGGVAHEFNNLLQAIQGYTQYAMAGLPVDDDRRHDLQQVIKASERATTLTRQLLGFSRREVLRLSDVNPNEQVHELVKMLRPLIGADIEVELKLAEDVGTVHADAGHLQHLLMNLCVNARDAMPQGGKLLIKTENLILMDDDSELRRDLEPGRYLVLSVSDNGFGMTADIRDRIFEPFFTTKGVGKGTGLGLPMVYGVVRQHKGTVRVYSEVDLGTTFRIYLPVNERHLERAQTTRSAESRGGNETILIAEDDPMVRDVAVRILQRAGYQTITAEDGVQAIELFERHHSRISLAVVDMVMPRLSGKDVYQRIKEFKPETQVVFCSGYDPEMAGITGLQERTTHVVHKPFDPEKLLDTIRDALDQELSTTD